MNLLDFKGRTAVITGGAQGIGLAVAERILKGGGAVCLWDRDEPLLRETTAKLGGAEAGVHGAAADIAEPANVAAAAEASLKALSKVDILINNAAIAGPTAPLWEYPPEAFHEVFRVGLFGTFHVTQAIVPHMIAADYGRIVNVASIAGKEGNPKASAYSSMKAGVIAMTKSLGKELADKNIAVNCVTPAVAATALGLNQAQEHIDYMLSKIPRGRMLGLDEASAMIGWLASEENSFSTGAIFDLSGGRATY